METLTMRTSVLTLLLLGLLAMAPAQTQMVPAPVPVPIPMPAAPTIVAPAHILMEFETSQVLVEGGADQRWEPASLVKVMTAYVVFGEIQAGRLALDDLVSVSERAWRMGGSRMFIEVGNRVSVEDLLRGMIIQSGNDASVALAEHVAGSEPLFAQMMNAYAEQLGMYNTQFRNATGWPDEEQYTTARDMALLARAMIRHHPQFYGYYSERDFTFNEIRQSNRNRLLWLDEGVDGLKTGHTSTAGYNLVTSGQREGMRLIAVVLGTSGPQARVDQTRTLLNYGFRFFRQHRFHSAGRPLAEPVLWKGQTDTVAVGVAQDINLVVPQRQIDSIRTELRITEPLIAPLTAGTVVGELVLRGDREVFANAPLVVLSDTPEGGFVRRLVDTVKLYFQ
jgi:serine-type D-Ala-D-Ala carboxypeptidase (penicillin-binding protein 5/6)